MRFKIVVISLCLLTSTKCSLKPTTETIDSNKGYIKDKNDRILILRQKPVVVELLLSSLITALGLGSSYISIFQKNNNNTTNLSTQDRILTGIGGALFTGVGITFLRDFYHKYKHQSDPLIILDKTGIWHEEWNEKIFWFNIQDIIFIKINEIIKDNLGNKYDSGFFWTIEIKTKQQQSFFIDERSTLMGTSNRSYDINPGGELGQMILQHYNKYKIIPKKNISN